MRLINADDLLKTLDGIWDCDDMVFSPNDHICDPLDCKGCKWRETLDFVKRQVKASRTVDAVPVVRCKDCKWWIKSIIHEHHYCFLDESCSETNAMGYCAWAVKKGGEHDGKE